MEERLEDLLLRLLRLTKQAQKRWEAELYADEDSGYEEGDTTLGELWLTLEAAENSMWTCGWRVQQDEATVWAIRASERLPDDAARALLALMS